MSKKKVFLWFRTSRMVTRKKKGSAPDYRNSELPIIDKFPLTNQQEQKNAMVYFIYTIVGCRKHSITSTPKVFFQIKEIIAVKIRFWVLYYFAGVAISQKCKDIICWDWEKQWWPLHGLVECEVDLGLQHLQIVCINTQIMNCNLEQTCGESALYSWSIYERYKSLNHDNL